MVATPDAGADELEVLNEGEGGVEGGTEIVEGVELVNGVCGGGGEEGADDPRDVGAVAALFWGFEEGNDFGFGKGEVKTVGAVSRILFKEPNPHAGNRPSDLRPNLSVAC